MKVLILANFGMGLYKFRKELITKLINKDMEVIVSFPQDEYTQRIEELGCTFIDIPLERRGTNPFSDLKLLFDYYKLINNEQPDVVLTFTIKPNIYGGLISRIKKIPYIGNITGLGTAVENPGLLQKITLFLYKISFKNIEKIFFQNQENMEFFAKHKINNEQHELIPGSGVNLKHFNLLPYPKEERIEFVFISRVMKEKGIEQYLDAAKYIKSRHPNTTFHICGFCEQNYEQILYSLEKQDIIKYHGMINDVRDILKVTHCTIHPTYYPEGISNVLLESAACGRPIITTNRAGTREVITDKETGFLIEEKNSEDLIEKINSFLRLSNLERENMGLSGRKKVELEFNRDIVVDRYLKSIESLKER